MPRRTVLCQIRDWQDISLTECLSLQKKKDAKLCFGCDACSRLCSKCWRKMPVCPELDLCINCLQKALAAEILLTEDALKKTISCNVCGCGKHLIYKSNAFGLCLRCGAKEFAGIAPAVQPSSNGHAPATPEASPEEQQASDGKDIAGLIENLSDIEQVIVTLHRREAYAMDKIGAILGLSAKTVSQMYDEALVKMKDSL